MNGSLHGFDNTSFDRCIKCTICTAYCPAARATDLYPGPKQSGPDAERLRIKSAHLVDGSLAYCLNCKRCEYVCPHGVRAASIITAAKNRYLKKNLFSLKTMRDYVIAHTDLLGFFGTHFTFVINTVMQFPPVRLGMQYVLGIPRQKRFPSYQRETFRRRFLRREKKRQNGFARQVVYFHGCAVNYQEHALGNDVIRVLNAFGFGVLLAKERCCGVPLIANGFLASAEKNARRNIAALVRAMPAPDTPIVSASSSCSYALKDEYAGFPCVDSSPIRDNVFYITKFLCEEIGRGNMPPLKKLAMKIAYHAPCHLQRAGGTIFTADILKRIPGLDARFLHSECCGLAGTYGFKTENYAISKKIGEELFRLIREADPDYVVTDCETCKWQIEMNTKYRVLHPVQLLAMALDSGA